MTKKDLVDRIGQYVDYLNGEIKQHGECREEIAEQLRYARDELYKIFPEIKPDGYKTAVEMIRENRLKEVGLTKILFYIN